MAHKQHFLLSAKARTLSVRQVFELSDQQAFECFKEVRWGHGDDVTCPRSILTIVINAAITSGARSGSFINSVNRRGTICHTKPNLSFSQPHSTSLPPSAVSFCTAHPLQLDLRSRLIRK